ncbi:MAG: homoserine O-acetyltransferase [Saprospiraceae bacterium]|nr:homoserine O-acetyltransferase [Saprospiraceae bacterium]
MLEIFKYQHPFHLESGEILREVALGYTCYGELNDAADNVIWICHALTANSDPTEWWPGLVGRGLLYDPNKYFIVCANMLGSCYGSTNPGSIDPSTGEPYGMKFPLLTIRDIVKALQLLKIELGVRKIHLATGGSMGGQQVLEWAIMEPNLIEHLVIIGTNAKHSPWGIAFNEAQRMALLADQTFGSNDVQGGKRGLEAARAIAMLSYRNYEAYHRTQMEEDEKVDDFRASSYQRYQGVKLSSRFSPLAYWVLAKAMDTHDVGRARGGLKKALSSIIAKSLVFGIETDFLFPIREQVFLQAHIPRAQLTVIDSPFGHDGFLIEFDQIANSVKSFLKGK